MLLATVPEDRLHHNSGVRLAIPAPAADGHDADAKRVAESVEVAERSLGNLRAFGDVLGGIGRDQARDASLIGQIGGFKRGSSSIPPLELEQPDSAGGGPRLLGDLLGGAGEIAFAKGAANKAKRLAAVPSAGASLGGPRLPGPYGA